MRMPRKKVVGMDAYYHCASRIGGAPDEYPFTDVDKEFGLKMVVELAEFFLIEPISLCWMGNHWHLVCFVPGQAPDLATAAARWNAYYLPRRRLTGLRLGREWLELDPQVNSELCGEAAAQMVDLSQFMRQLNQRFTFYYNRAHRRRGTLWADRFKSTILDGRESLWSCVKYVELNPVRAHLTEDPAAYRFSSWGWFSGGGKHLFGDNFVKHLRRSLGDRARAWSACELEAEFRGELARTLAVELEEKSGEELAAAVTEGRREESMPVRYLRRTRHFTDGAIIGSKAFVQEVGCRFEEQARVMKRQFGRGRVLAGGGEESALYCLKRLQPLLE